MDQNQALQQLKEYNKTLSYLTCSKLEKEYIRIINESKYFYGFVIKEDLVNDATKFIHDNHQFKGLLKDKYEKLCFYIKNITNYTCNKQLIRMDARSQNFSYYSSSVYQAIASYYLFYGLNLDIKKAIYGEYRQFPIHINYSVIIATELLLENQEVIQYCKDVLTSENNAAVLTRHVIQAIEQSHNKELQDLLIQVFLAAKLQEGLRQSVIETADEYDINFFYRIVDIIKEHDLLRYSSVQRGILTWIGIGYVVVEERLIKEIFACIYDYIHNEDLRLSALEDVNPLHVYIALYVLGIKDVDLAIHEAIHLLDKSHHIIASALIYLKLTNHFDCIKYMHLPKKYKEDEWILSLYISECLRIDYSKVKISKEEINTLYDILYEYSKNIKTQQKYSSKGFEWFYIEITKYSVILKLLQFIELQPDKDKITRFLPYVSSLYKTKVEVFMENYFSYVNLEDRKDFLLKEIISHNEDLTKYVEKEYLNLKLTKNDIIQLESRLKTKKSYARAHIVHILANQKTEMVLDSYERLSQSNTKHIQEAAFEIKKLKPNYFEQVEQKVEIIGKDKGFSLYTPKTVHTLTYKSRLTFKEKGFLFKKQKVLNLGFLQPLTKPEVLDYLNKWNERIKKHALDEYEIRGEYRQVGQRNFYPITYQEKTLDSIPLGELWRDYFKKDQLSSSTLFQIIFQLKSIDIYFDKIMEPGIQIFTLSEEDKKPFEYYHHIQLILNYYFEERKNECKTNILQFIELMNRFTKYKQYNRPNFQGVKVVHSIASLECFAYMLSQIDYDELSDEEFKEIFPTHYHAYLQFHIGCREACEGKLNIPLLVLSRAVVLGIIPQEVLYEAILDTHTIAQEGSYYSHSRKHRLFDAYRDAYFKGRGIYSKPDFSLYGNHEALIHLRNTLDEIVDVLLPMEASRFNEETEVTHYVTSLSVIRGTKHLIQALQVLDKEEIKRQSYGSDRNTVFTNVIRHCYPNMEDNINPLKDFDEKRLVEVAMLAPQWIDIISNILDWDGFKDACYYFIAHMKEYNYDQKKAEIASFTDIDPSDLNDGAFDMEWCKNIYASLGEKRFMMIYHAAKFLCDNGFHTRARKYADAALNKVNKEDFLEQVKKTRNKDALNAYCISPISNDQDLLERYLNIQKFLKESKQFGAQRQASEARCSEIALMNLARNSRFETTTRLSWMMETETVNQYTYLLQPQDIGEIEACISIDENGKNEIIIYKNKKKQKSIPTKYKNHEKILQLKEIHKLWKEQYQRSKEMLENAMIDRTLFTIEEIHAIMKNPIVAPMMKKLVLMSNQQFGFYENGKLKGLHEIIDFDSTVRIAHPYDLYKNQNWHEYQSYIFEEKIIQPFKQVFRELYLKLEDEIESNYTKRYSGYQIQIQKTKGTLKSRKWNVSYENGLEKVCYKDDLVVSLYADADWFSPSDIEAPSIDYVGFTNRKNHKSILVKDINDILYSEIMRDVDLAVSVAYVGGVDPITSFSTIELRKAIIEFTSKLMKLNNLTFSDNFVNIQGKINNYSVHLGSGNIHQKGGPAIHILPVYSEKRGHVYLPFLDEDPTCAQILSKVILLAEDYKIKDPAILDQIISK